MTLVALVTCRCIPSQRLFFFFFLILHKTKVVPNNSLCWRGYSRARLFVLLWLFAVWVWVRGLPLSESVYAHNKYINGDLVITEVAFKALFFSFIPFCCLETGSLSLILVVLGL